MKLRTFEEQERINEQGEIEKQEKKKLYNRNYMRKYMKAYRLKPEYIRKGKISRKLYNAREDVKAKRYAYNKIYKARKRKEK